MRVPEDAVGSFAARIQSRAAFAHPSGADGHENVREFRIFASVQHPTHRDAVKYQNSIRLFVIPSFYLSSSQ